VFRKGLASCRDNGLAKEQSPGAIRENQGVYGFALGKKIGANSWNLVNIDAAQRSKTR